MPGQRTHTLTGFNTKLVACFVRVLLSTVGSRWWW